MGTCPKRTNRKSSNMVISIANIKYNKIDNIQYQISIKPNFQSTPFFTTFAGLPAAIEC